MLTGPVLFRQVFMDVRLNFSHEPYVASLSVLSDIDFYITGGNTNEGLAEDYETVIGRTAPDNIHFTNTDDPDVVVQGPGADIRVTHNVNTSPLTGGTTVYTTESKLADTPPDSQYLLIRHGIDTDRFSGWDRDNEGNVLTSGNNIGNRNGSFDVDIHEALISSEFTYRAYGRNCKDGFIERDTLINRLQNASVYVNFSRTIIPTALLEAMALGMPIVTIPGYGNTDAITHGHNGLVADNRTDFVQSVEYLTDNPEFAGTLGETARQTVKGRYSRGEFASRWNLLFQSEA